MQGFRLAGAQPYLALWEALALQFDEAGLAGLSVDAPRQVQDYLDWVDYRYIDNHFVCNGAVICPFFDDPNDDAARERLEDAYPSLEIRVIDARTLVAIGGSIHYITQQRPKDVS